MNNEKGPGCLVKESPGPAVWRANLEPGQNPLAAKARPGFFELDCLKPSSACSALPFKARWRPCSFWIIPVLLLVLLAAAWARPEPPAIIPPASEAAPASISPEEVLLVGSFWQGRQGERFLFDLRLGRLTATPKRWWLFTFQDQWDLRLDDCDLHVAEADLTSLWEGLLPLLGRVSRPAAATAVSGVGPLADQQQPRLIQLPPQLTSSPFTCRLAGAKGGEVSLQAATAVLQPPEPSLHLQDGVEIRTAAGTILTTPELYWRLLEKLLVIPGTFTLVQADGRCRFGDRGQFRLEGGSLVWVANSDQIVVLPPSGPPSFLPWGFNPSDKLSRNPQGQFFRLLFLPGTLNGIPTLP